jgi:cell division septation protein DedD
MSDDQSFYEIQLNTPHLVLAFLGAAVVGVAVFWLGVVIGRGQSDAGMSADWQAAIPGEEAPATGEEEPFEFYEAVGDPATGGQAAADSTAPATGQQPAGTPAGTGVQPADPPRPETAPPATETVASPPATTSRTGMPASDPSLVSGWIIQVRSTTEKPEADDLQSTLSSAGFPAFVVSVEVEGRTYYRVRVGRYRTPADARAVEALLVRRIDVESTWVTEG